MGIKISSIEEEKDEWDEVGRMNERNTEIENRSSEADLGELRLERVRLEGKLEGQQAKRKRLQQAVDNAMKELGIQDRKIAETSARLKARLRAIHDLEISTLGAERDD